MALADGARVKSAPAQGCSVISRPCRRWWIGQARRGKPWESALLVDCIDVIGEGHRVTTAEPLDRSAVGAAFLAVAARRPDAVALRWDVDTAPRSMTYGELSRRTTRLSQRILEELAPGDRLALWSANTPEWVITQLAAALAGVVLVPINPALTESETRFILTSSGARLLLAGPPWRGRDLVAEATALAATLPGHRRGPPDDLGPGAGGQRRRRRPAACVP